MLEWREIFTSGLFPFKRGAVQNRTTTGIIPLEGSQRTQCLLFFPGQEALEAQALGGRVQPGACPTYLPTCALEHKAPCLPSPTQMPPSPQPSCWVRCQQLPPLKVPLQGYSEALVVGCPHYCVETGSRDAFSTIQSASQATRHGVKQPGSWREGKGSFLFKHQPL